MTNNKTFNTIVIVLVVFEKEAIMICRNIEIKNKNGLHLRVASDIVKISKAGNSNINISCDDCPNKKADGCSILELLSLGAKSGEILKVTVDGEDEELIIRKLNETFSEGSGI